MELSKDQFKCLLGHLYSMYKDHSVSFNLIQFKENWECVLSKAFENNCIWSPESILMHSGSEIEFFEQELIFPNVKLTFEYNINTAYYLISEFSLLSRKIPISLFEMFPCTQERKYYIYYSVTSDQSISSHPIIIANLPINTDILGYVIDGNHRVTYYKGMGMDSISAYVLNEKLTNNCLLYVFQKALHMYLCDISDILQDKANNIILYNRMLNIKKYLNNIKKSKVNSIAEQVYKAARATNVAAEMPGRMTSIPKKKLDILESDIK